jgi:catalase
MESLGIGVTGGSSDHQRWSLSPLDAVALMISDDAALELANDPAARDFISDAYAHSKFIAYVASVLPLIKATLGDRDLDGGFVKIDAAKAFAKFIEICLRFRFWERAAEASMGNKTKRQ